MGIQETLFTDDFPIVRNQAELDLIIKKFLRKEYDTYYISSGCIKDRRDKFDNLWKTFAPYADLHFLNQYKHQFHQRSWEMFVGCVFLNNNFRLRSNSFGPDFIVNNEDYIECIACNNASEGKVDFVPNMEYGVVQNVPTEQIILRITSAIEEKSKKYKNWKSINKSMPYVLAINSGKFMHPQDYMGIPLIVKALFGLQFLQIKQNGVRSFSRRNESQKGGAKIPVNYFRTDLYKEISGIIFSDKDVLNNEKDNGEDCFFINNPFAINRVNFENYKFFKNWKAENNKLTKLYDGGLQLNFE